MAAYSLGVQMFTVIVCSYYSNNHKWPRIHIRCNSFINEDVSQLGGRQFTICTLVSICAPTYSSNHINVDLSKLSDVQR